MEADLKAFGKKITYKMCPLKLLRRVSDLFLNVSTAEAFFIPVAVQNKLFSSEMYFLATFWCSLHSVI